MLDIMIAIPPPPSSCTSWGAHVASGLHFKRTRSCPPKFRLLKDVCLYTVSRQAQVCGHVCILQGVLESYNLLYGERRLGGKSGLSGSWAQHPRADPGGSRGADPQPGQPEARGSSSCTVATMASATVQRLCCVPHHVAQKDILIGL